MKKTFLLLALLFFAGTVSAQESGNRIYGNRGYYNQQRRQPQTNTGNLASNRSSGYSIEASVLTNLKPDAFVAVFGINEEASASAASNEKVNAKINEFARAMSGLGISRNEIFVDFITQNRVYDYTVQGAQATENFSGFETKKTIAVRYKRRDLFEKILAAAANVQIFDLIKVDYIVSDFDAVRARLFEEAVKVIKAKEAKYVNSFGVKLEPVGLANEKYDAFYPSESYERYQAYETGEAYTSYTNSSKVIQRKSFTFFYQPFDGSHFDAVINALDIEPVVQFTLYLRMDYDWVRSKER
ncbi:MAG: SIMPL domain-containing protein [Pyrinomonadaceae bacterium]|nr:SIMPL domain-containing protein [Pyrinomonadaceae bacterium]